ncbi:MAG: methylisocitrate lyase [Leptospiraceae bacterium]|nr:methylisocitrate lyase [Leptospiraceae bacterium]MDW8305937.1 methylisocitrate lyase [Leptospiraceae bacterium]
MAWMLKVHELVGGTTLSNLLQQERILLAPGAHDAITALLAKKLGFKCLYISGAAFSASRAMPDIGYFTVSELADHVRQLYRACELPLIVDADTGFGEVVHIPRTVYELEEAGAAAIQIEDQKLPKKCGHLEGKELISADDMCRKIEAFLKTRKRVLLVARTDARAIHGLDEAIRRARMYTNAGADIIFPEALQSEEEFRTFAQEIKVPLLANMTEFGKTPYFTAEQFASWGYKIVIFPVTSLRVAMKAVEQVFRAILQEGTQKNYLDQMQTRQELYELIDYADYGSFDEGVARSKYI